MGMHAGDLAPATSDTSDGAEEPMSNEKSRRWQLAAVHPHREPAAASVPKTAIQPLMVERNLKGRQTDDE